MHVVIKWDIVINGSVSSSKTSLDTSSYLMFDQKYNIFQVVLLRLLAFYNQAFSNDYDCLRPNSKLEKNVSRS